MGLDYYYIIVVINKKFDEYYNFFSQKWMDLKVSVPNKQIHQNNPAKKQQFIRKNIKQKQTY